jgi:CheY-like chemotaxis protein
MSISILLADDDTDDQFFFKEALKSIDPLIKLVIANDGQDALKKLESFTPELIFLDINMPFKTGKECLKLIRRDKALKDIPIVMYTTSSDGEDINDCFHMGANLYVSKPLSQDDNIKILTAIFHLYHENKLNNPTEDVFVFHLPIPQKGS